MTLSAKRIRHNISNVFEKCGNYSTLFVCVNTGATENAKMDNARRSKSDTGKPETVTEFNV